MDRCIVIGGEADGDVVDVEPNVNYMRVAKARRANPHLTTTSLEEDLEIGIYRKEFLKAQNKNGSWVEIPFLVEKSLSTADALRKVLFSYRTKK